MILFAKFYLNSYAYQLFFPITLLSLIRHLSVPLILKVPVPPITFVVDVFSKLRKVKKLLNAALKENSVGSLWISFLVD